MGDVFRLSLVLSFIPNCAAQKLVVTIALAVFFNSSITLGGRCLNYHSTLIFRSNNFSETLEKGFSGEIFNSLI